MSLLEYLNPPPEVTITDYSPLHYKYINSDDKHYREISKVVSVEQMLEYQASIGMAFTAMLYGQPVAAFGSIQLWPGVEEVWSLMSERSRTHAKTLTRIAKRFVDFRMKSGGLHRVQMGVRCDDTRAVQWASALGFDIDGVMRKYGTDGSDFYIMSKVQA